MGRFRVECANIGEGSLIIRQIKAAVRLWSRHRQWSGTPRHGTARQGGAGNGKVKRHCAIPPSLGRHWSDSGPRQRGSELEPDGGGRWSTESRLLTNATWRPLTHSRCLSIPLCHILCTWACLSALSQAETSRMFHSLLTTLPF